MPYTYVPYMCTITALARFERVYDLSEPHEVMRKHLYISWDHQSVSTLHHNVEFPGRDIDVGMYTSQDDQWHESVLHIILYNDQWWINSYHEEQNNVEQNTRMSFQYVN